MALAAFREYSGEIFLGYGAVLLYCQILDIPNAHAPVGRAEYGAG